jgi:hypothetical protein
LRWNKVHCPRRPILNINANRNQPAIKETDMGYVQERHIPSRAEIVVGMIGDAIRRMSDRREFARFVDDCPGEADRLARDLNIDKASLQKLAGSGRNGPVLLNRRLLHLGLDPAKLSAAEPAVAQDLARCCALCGSKSRCEKDLDRRPNSADWRHYCPNGLTLGALGPAITA